MATKKRIRPTKLTPIQKVVLDCATDAELLSIRGSINARLREKARSKRISATKKRLE